MKVEVYKNLHKDCFSVRQKGKVIDHVIWPEDLHLTKATFVVQPGGRERVRREKVKNVHAFVKGIDTPIGGLLKKVIYNRCRTRVTYDPYTMETFQTMEGEPVTYAEEVLFRNNEVYVGKYE